MNKYDDVATFTGAGHPFSDVRIASAMERLHKDDPKWQHEMNDPHAHAKSLKEHELPYWGRKK